MAEARTALGQRRGDGLVAAEARDEIGEIRDGKDRQMNKRTEAGQPRKEGLCVRCFSCALAVLLHLPSTSSFGSLIPCLPVKARSGAEKGILPKPSAGRALFFLLLFYSSSPP